MRKYIMRNRLLYITTLLTLLILIIVVGPPNLPPEGFTGLYYKNPIIFGAMVGMIIVAIMLGYYLLAYKREPDLQLYISHVVIDGQYVERCDGNVLRPTIKKRRKNYLTDVSPIDYSSVIG